MANHWPNEQFRGLLTRPGFAKRRTGPIAYDAVVLDEESIKSKVQNLHGMRGCICGGHKREGRCALPGETSSCALCYWRQEASGMRLEESSRGHISRTISGEGPNLKMMMMMMMMMMAES